MPNEKKDKNGRKTGARDTPVWTKALHARAVPITGLPAELQAKLKPQGRGPQKAPTKVKVSIRLSPDVAAALRATGNGWQSQVDQALRLWIKGQKKKAA